MNMSTLLRKQTTFSLFSKCGTDTKLFIIFSRIWLKFKKLKSRWCRRYSTWPTTAPAMFVTLCVRVHVDDILGELVNICFVVSTVMPPEMQFSRYRGHRGCRLNCAVGCHILGFGNLAEEIANDNIFANSTKIYISPRFDW